MVEVKYLKLQFLEENNMDYSNFKLKFNPDFHKYIDNNGGVYTSMTTVIGKYVPKFESEKVALACSRKRGHRYYGKSVKEILEIWGEYTDVALEKGNRTHNHLESIVKQSTNFKFVEVIDSKKYQTLYTITDVLTGEHKGILDVDLFLGSGIKDKYPRIYRLFMKLHEMGYSFFSELGVFSLEHYISGLIDIIAINLTTKTFIIVDWKTNKDKLIPLSNYSLRLKSGYYEKDKFGNQTENYIFTNKKFHSPLIQLETSTYNKYNLQLSGYANLASRFGLTCEGLYLCHILENYKYSETDIEVQRFNDLLGKDRTDIYEMEDYNPYVIQMFNHFKTTNQFQSVLQL